MGVLARGHVSPSITTDAETMAPPLAEQFGAILDIMTPHLARAGAPALLVLALRVASTGRACPLSENDLLRLLQCSRSTIRHLVALNRELGVLTCRPGTTPGRRGPAPLVWAIPDAQEPASTRCEGERALLPGTTPSPCREVVRGSNETASSHHGGDAVPQRLRTSRSDQIPDPIPDPIQEGPIDPGLAPSTLAALIETTAAQLGERNAGTVERAIAPVLAAAQRAGWSLPALRTLLDEAVTATRAHRPSYPAAYLVRVLRQRLGDELPTVAITPTAMPGRPPQTARGARWRGPSWPAELASDSIPAPATAPPADQPSAIGEGFAWRPPETIPGLPCAPAAALRAACTTADLSTEAYLRGAVLAGWAPDGQLLVVTPAPVPAGIAARLRPRLEHGLSELLGRRVACRLVPAGELGTSAADGLDPDQLAPMPRAVRRLTG